MGEIIPEGKLELCILTFHNLLLVRMGGGEHHSLLKGWLLNCVSSVINFDDTRLSG